MFKFITRLAKEFKRWRYKQMAETLPDTLESAVKDSIDQKYQVWLNENGYTEQREPALIGQIQEPIALCKEKDEELDKLDQAWNGLYRHINRTRSYDKGFVISANYTYPEPELDYRICFISRDMDPHVVSQTLYNIAEDFEQEAHEQRKKERA